MAAEAEEEVEATGVLGAAEASPKVTVCARGVCVCVCVGVCVCARAACV
jgi:hypothetical protein